MPIITDKSRKWIITIFMSVLIVAFALPSYFGQGGPRRDFPVATVFGENITEGEMENAKREWEMMRRVELVPGSGLPLTIRLFAPADLLMLSRVDQNFFQTTFARARILESAVAGDPKLYALLKRDAARRGITPSLDSVEALLVNQIRLPEGTPAEQRNGWRGACANFLAVEGAIQQAATAVKISRPVVQSAIASNLQSLSLNVVLFDANEFRAQIPPPSDDTIQTLYTENSEKLPNAPIDGDARYAPTNYGFGYKLNNGVRLEYIALSTPELARAAKASKTAHDWDVEANRYYLQNKAEFIRLPTPPPATTSPTTQQAPASTQPVQQPFPEVRQQILTQLYETKTQQLQTQVERRLVQLLSSDYRQFADAKLKTATPPATSVGNPVGSFDYLRAIAAKVEKETGVLPEVTTFGDRYLDAPAFDREEVGRATLADSPAQRPLPLGVYLLTRAKPFYAAANVREPGATALEMLEPTPVFSAGTTGSRPVIIARLLDARASTTLPLANVKDQVREDAIQRAATEAAHKAADAFLAQAAKSSVRDAATAAGRKLITAPTLTSSGSSLPTDLFALSQPSQATFIKSAFDLLRGDPKPGQSRVVVALPRDRKVAVLELEGTQPLAPGVEAATLELDMQYAARLNAVNEFLINYLNPTAILARTQYVDLTGRAKPVTTQPETEKN